MTTLEKLSSLELYPQLVESLRSLPLGERAQTLRWFARNDLYFLLRYILRRADAEQPFVFDRCREVEADPNDRLDLWAREHYKSTIVTFAKTIQDILRTHGDDAVGEEITIGFFGQTRPLAKKALSQIMREFEINEPLKQLFPDILWADPQKQAPKWSLDDGIIVRRKSNPKESTIEAWGLVDGQPAGPHYGLRVYDDTVTLDDVRTPEMIDKTVEYWEMSLNLSKLDAPARYVGTFYAARDPHHVMIERGIRPRIYPCTFDGSENFTPENCVLMAPDLLRLKRRRMGQKTFATQMLLDPKKGFERAFTEANLRYWPAFDTSSLTLIIIVDPASAKKKSDKTAMWVLGLGADSNWYVVDLLYRRMDLKTKVTSLIALHREYDPSCVFYEEYGMQADIEAVQWEQQRQNYRFDVLAVGGKMAKSDRIERLNPLVTDHRLYLPENGRVHLDHEGRAIDTIRQFVNEEFLNWPVVTHDDGLDSLSRVEDENVKLLVSPPIREAPEKSGWREEAEDEWWRGVNVQSGRQGKDWLAS